MSLKRERSLAAIRVETTGNEDDTRFELTNDDIGVIGHYETKTDALRVAIPGDSLFDRMARSGDVELWIVSGDLDRKILSAIRRKHD